MSNNNTFDKIFDTLLNEALKAVESEPNPDLPEEMDIEFSDKHNAEMKKIFDREKKKILRKKLYKSAQRVAAVFVVLIMVSGITVMSVNALKVRVLNFIFNTYPTNTEITTDEKAEHGTYETDKLSLDYIPSGFTFQRQTISDDMIRLMFSNETDDILIIICKTPEEVEMILSTNTENVNFEQLMINNNKALYVENKDENILAVLNDTTSYTINGLINKDEMVKIAQNLKIK